MYPINPGILFNNRLPYKRSTKNCNYDLEKPLSEMRMRHRNFVDFVTIGNATGLVFVAFDVVDSLEQCMNHEENLHQVEHLVGATDQPDHFISINYMLRTYDL